MNNRIKELAGEAGYNPDVYEMCKTGMEKFAQLIVAECLAQVDKADAASEDDSEKIGIATVGYAIAKHFGVE